MGMEEMVTKAVQAAIGGAVEYIKDSAGTFFEWALSSAYMLFKDYFPFFVLLGIMLFLFSTIKSKRKWF